MSPVRITKVQTAGAGIMTRQEVEEFLRGKFLIRLATVDSNGDPMIQPTWYYYHDEKLYLMTGAATKKVGNIRKKSTVYFSVDTEVSPYRGVKGKARAKVVSDIDRAVSIVKEISEKYTGRSDTPMAKSFVESTNDGSEVVIEIVPEYFAVWDYGKPDS
jgi:nitroimidazol reductase NimA-like FMN-containing flavoprotein (pyridoxamine 5'-phosphate oxidase superfamily)